MRARDIHAAAEQLSGEALRWTSVKAALAASRLAVACDVCGVGRNVAVREFARPSRYRSLSEAGSSTG